MILPLPSARAHIFDFIKEEANRGWAGHVV